MDKKNNQDIEYKCDVCGELFPEELVNNYILKNRKVYCEKCGSQFRTDLKDGMKSKSQRRKSKKSTRAKRPIKQTVRSKRSYSQPSPPAPPVTRQKDIIITPSFKTLKSARQKTSESNLNSLRSVINVLDFIIKYQFFIFIGSLVTIFRLAGVAIFWSITPIFGNIGNIIDIIVRLIMLIIINRYAIEKVSRKVSEGDFSNFGIDAIVIGILGMGCYGMGGVILAEGIIILIHEFLIRENNLIEQIKRPDSFNYMLLWANTFEQGILTINSILLELTVLNFILGIPQIMEIFNLSPIGLLTIMPFIACLLTISYIRQKVTPTINSMPLQEVNDEILVWSIILGAVSILFSGTGLYLLGISIFIFIYKGLVAEIQKKAQIRTINKVIRKEKGSKKPVSIDKEPEIKEDIVKQPSVKEKEPISEKQLPRYATDKNQDSKTPMPIPISSKKKSKEKNQKESKIDSKLQEIPIVEVDESRSELIKALDKKNVEKISKSKKPIKMEEYLDKIFTVLTEKIRSRLLSLNLPEEQKWDIVQEFINLKEEQQDKYLKELENITRKINKKLIKRIMKMDLTAAEKQNLIEQIEIMTPEDQVQFVKFLEVQK